MEPKQHESVFFTLENHSHKGDLMTKPQNRRHLTYIRSRSNLIQFYNKVNATNKRQCH